MASIHKHEVSRCKARKNALFMSTVCRGIALLFGLLIFVCAKNEMANAQNYLTATGAPSFSAPEPVEYGFTEAANGNLHLEFPLGSFPQRGSGQPYQVRLIYDSHLWTTMLGSSGQTWTPTLGGWKVAAAGSGLLSEADYGSLGGSCGADFSWTDRYATTHVFALPNVRTVGSNSGCVMTGDAYATDSSGFHMFYNYTGYTITIYAPDGTIIWNQTISGNNKDPQGNTILTEDTNGNYFSQTPTNSVLDTLQRVPLKSSTCGSGTCYDMSNSQADTSRSHYALTNATIAVSSAFHQSGIAEGSYNLSVIQSITLPDNTTFSFKYDCDSSLNSQACSSPHGQSGYYGVMTSMTTQTGGTVTYSYTIFADSYGNKTNWLTTRSGSGYSTYTPQVITTCSSTSVGCQQKLTVRKPSGDSTVYTFTLDNGSWPTLIQEYDAQNNLMSTTTNTWDFSVACVLHGCHGHNFIRLLSQTVAVPMPGGSQLTKKAVYGYDTPQKGNVTSAKQWKFQPGTSPTFPTVPDRATYISYYAAGANIINKPLSVTQCSNSGSDTTNCPGGGSRVSQTVTTYDSYSSCPSGLKSVTNMSNHDDANFGTTLTQRGNATQVQSWVSGTTFLTSSVCYDTTGQVYQSSDPIGTVTAYDYTDNFFTETGATSTSTYTPTAPTNAYPKIITVSGLTTTFGYYFGSGKTAFATDQNGVTTSSYFWDSFDRPTQTSLPIGWSLATYTSATQGDVYAPVADATASSSCSSCQHKQFNFDSWGRKTNEKLVNAPGGAVNVDTTYDSMSRVQSVSHAYRTTSDPTHVFESVTYDGLGRTVSTTHPDGQASHVSYGATVGTFGGVTTQQSSTATYGYGYPVLTIDEAGKERQEWIDGFGQIIEVDEPSTTGINGTGSVTISGTEQNPVRFNPCPPPITPCWQSAPDNGTVSITVGGYTVSTNFGASDTGSTIASNLAGLLNSGSSPVTATSSGNTVSITSIAEGTAGNLSLSAASSDQFAQYGISPSFSPSPSGSTLTGGAAGISVSPIVTSYIYNILGNLTTVAQGLQTRTFVYDGLSRVTSRITPEAGTDNFYFTKADGITLCAGLAEAVCRKTDARGITTTYTYDPLNRQTGKTYSNGQGAVTYQYDQGGAAVFALGRLTTLTDPSGSEAYSYNQMGWLTQAQKTIGTTAFTTQYQYNVGGQVTQITYPSNRVIQQNVDSVGLLNSVVSGGTTYASVPEPPTGYDAAGNLLQFTYANGVVANFVFSPTRNQMTNLSYTKGATLFALNYGYAKGQANCDNTTVAGNNGAIQCIQDTVDNGRSAIYTYDPLSRLATAVTSGSTGYGKWGLSWAYDRYGNRSNQNQTFGSPPMNSLTFATTPQPPTNPPGGAYTNRPDGYSFDASGNILYDGTNNLTYDAENCLTSAGTTTYTCDANGVRVKKGLSGSTNTIYIFSGGDDVAEYDYTSGNPSPGSPSREYIYLDGRLIATIQGTSTFYHHSDHLSVRYTTDANGNYAGEQGHYPYGEQWYAHNTTTKFFFTSYERDSESGNDYAMARFYINRFGRFSCVDPALGSPGDPQSWNRYAYVRNNPVNMTDPSGQWWLPKLFGGIMAILGVLTGDPELTQVGLDLAGAHNFGSLVDNLTGSNGRTPSTFPGGTAGLPPAPIGGNPPLSSVGIDESGGFGGIGSGFTDPDFAPCEKVSASDLDYSVMRRYGRGKRQKQETAKEHIIRRHVDPTTSVGNSQYHFFPRPGQPDNNESQFAGVKKANSFTFSHPFISTALKDNQGNVTGFRFTSFEPAEYPHPVLGEGYIGVWIGTDRQVGFLHTNLNTLYLGPDCKTVQTSHPGIP